LRRIYVWSVEFGLLGDAENFCAHGAALLSSPEEFRATRAGHARTLPYSSQALRHENAFSEVLTGYFVARDFAQYLEVLAEYETTMQHRLRTTTDATGRALAPPATSHRVRHA
jgi:phenylalanine-4-hydroxylase